MDLAKLKRDLERVHPGGTYTIDARQLKQLLGMAEAKVDPWRMFRQTPATQEQLAHIEERLTALEEVNPPPAEARQLTGAEILEESRRQVQATEVDTERVRHALRHAIETEGFKTGHIAITTGPCLNHGHAWANITIEVRKP